jgi:hypothetical protein
MKPLSSKTNAGALLLCLLPIVLSGAVWAQSQEQHAAPSAPANQKGFKTPQLAAEALIKAAESYDVPALLEIFGPQGEDFIQSADPVNDKNVVQRFAEKARERHSVNIEKGRAILQVGTEYWPLPIPIVKRQGQWYFDSKAGHDEILFRRIGANELDAIQICHGYVEAQKEYALTPHGNPPVHQYAQKIISTPGQQDGLFWKNPDGSPGGPISEGVARALEEGYSEKAAPYHGYYFKILMAQGPNAQFGQIDYMINGVMLGGFALVAVPAEYRVTGVKTFMVSHWGVVYEKDLGPDSLKSVKEMTEFNPDKTWHPTRDKLLLAGK